MNNFKLGELVMTRSIVDRMNKDIEFAYFIDESFSRYLNKDWGNTCKHDSKMNDKAIKNNDDRIVAKYISNNYDEILIITEWDRSYTTILFLNEY